MLPNLHSSQTNPLSLPQERKKCTAQEKKAIWAGVLGNALELYDYTIYAFFAAIIAAQFFPSDDPSISLLATFGVYATGFFLRPVGGIFIAKIGDTYGRKKALEVSILLMAVPTVCIGLLPDYHQAGILGPCLLIVMRMLQGISVGGELVGSYVFLNEHSQKHRRSFVSSWSLVGSYGGKWIGTFVAFLMGIWLTTDHLHAWGWRLPFVAGILFAAAGYRLRREVTETPSFKSLQQNNLIVKSPLKETLITAMPNILLGIGCLVINTAPMHLLFIYLPTYLIKVLDFSHLQAMTSNLLALTSAILITPFSAQLADRFGKQQVQLMGMIALTATMLPGFAALSLGNLYLSIIIHSILAAIYAFMYAPFPSFLSELFPPPVRYTGMAVSYNIGVALFGGLTPMVVTWLTGYFNHPAAPAAWMIACGLISFCSLLAVPLFIPCMEVPHDQRIRL